MGAGLEPACIKSCPTGCLHFGTKDDMKFLAEKRATQLRDVSGFKDAGVYDPDTIGGTHVIYVLHDINKPETVRRPAGEAAHSAELHHLEGLVQADRAVRRDDGICRRGHALRLRRSAARAAAAADQADRSATTADGKGELDGDLPRIALSIARTPSTAWARPWFTSGELLRHPVYTRFLHWMVGIFFFLALLSGFGIYLPWIFRFFTPLFGGGAMTRFLHPWFGLGFVFFFALQALNWWQVMTWTPADSRWMKHIKEYVTRTDSMESPDTGFFNAGQKLHVLGDRVAAASPTSSPASSCGSQRSSAASWWPSPMSFTTSRR